MRLKGTIGALVTVLGLGLWSAAGADEAEVLKTYARGDYEAVVRMLEGPYKEGQAKIQERLILARALLHLERRDEALKVLRSVLDSDRENPEANALTGRTLHESGKDKEALPYLKDAHRLKQDAVTASTLGKCYYALGDLPKAKALLEKALAEDIRDPSNALLLGKICLATGFGALAERYLLQAEEAGLDSAELHLLLGRAYLAQHKEVGPILTLRIPGGAGPGQVVHGHVVLGPAEGAPDRYRVCTRFSALYEGYWLLKREPQSADALYMLAAGWLAAADVDEASDHVRRLEAVEPRSPRVLELELRILIAKAAFDGLESVLTAARSENRVSARAAAEYYYQAALVCRAQGNRPEAVRLLKKAEELHPTSSKVLRSLADLSLATGRPKEARGYYARMVELFPDAPDIDELRNALKVLQEKRGAERGAEQ
ncbi:MAG TPA: tetratricopeptide repeat protein [Phycisphaerae bacterium]|nr:tetratricopeptide repeat protein [Phycisphaerae bacterium]